jgi:small conductance mechanosensitive channel
MLILVLFLAVASFAKSLARRIALRRLSHQGMALLLARLVHTSIAVLGLLISISVIAPSFQAADLIKVLGVGTVAIGFAFQNILQNFLAGILLLMQEPFRLGDLISVTGIEGNVSDIQGQLLQAFALSKDLIQRQRTGSTQEKCRKAAKI